MGISASSRLVALGTTLGVLVAAGCTGDDGSAPTTSAVATTTTQPPGRTGDGQLSIGLLLPLEDPALGQYLVDAATVAVERINAAGGVLGRDVRLLSAEEGTSESAARESVTSLTGQGVDAIVGPSSSLIALSTLDDIISTGVVTCSPTASALALDDYPDGGLFFRTVPSDSLQAVAMSDIADRTGVQNVAVVYVDDAYGRPFARTVEAALIEGSRSITDVESFGFTRGDGGLDNVASSVAASEAPVVMLLAGADDAVAFLEALGRTDHSRIGTIVVNDPIRTSTVGPLIEALDDDLREKIVGVAPQATSGDPDEPFDPPGPFAANAYDCVNLIALAATVVQTDDPALFRSQIPALSTGGAVCDGFATCAELIRDGLDVNYNGPDGITELLQVGDPARARFDVFVFDEDGEAVVDRTVIASSI